MTPISEFYAGFKGILSLQPLVNTLKKMIREGKPGARKLYQGVINEIEGIPALLQSINEPEGLGKNEELVETLLSTIFPPSSSSNEGIYAVTFPFRPETIYASPGFKRMFIKEGSNSISVDDPKAVESIGKAGLCLAYNLILKKFYNIAAPLTATSVHSFTDKESGLTRYYELKLNAQFVDVTHENKDFKLPENLNPQDSLEADKLNALFPLEHFKFEGLIVNEVTDVTQDQVNSEIRNLLLSINAFSDASVYDELQQHVQSLIGLKNVKIGITPFFKKNGYYLYTEAHYRNSLLFCSQSVKANKDKISDLSRKVFRNIEQPVLFETLTDEDVLEHKLLNYYKEIGARSLILCPLRNEHQQLIGLLEIMSEDAGRLQLLHLARVQPSIMLFSLALEKSAENLDVQIEKIIKDHFTAIQPAVEWKFTEVAFKFLQQKQVNEMAKMPPISFEDVHPLYGAIDIRNSSVERSNSIQLDLLEQLNLARNVLVKARKVISFPLLNETLYRIDKYISSATESLLSDDEMLIYDFLQYQLDTLFKSLQLLRPELKKTIDQYLKELDPDRKIIFHHRKDYEESITRVNDVLDRFMDQEQAEAQEIYPHYFERYVTDGIEFNIYVGQSLSPNSEYNDIFVRNLKLWQLTLLAKAARLTHSLEKKLPLVLQTTQLILAHSIPLNISFRRKERKFDVDGAYNIRYEIVKKRIDKVHIRDSEERLTQPGKIGIVYSQQKEMNEYLEYIEYLQQQKLLGENVEFLDLEDTQGISGLKAIRVDVNLIENNPGEPRQELSNVTSQQLLK